MSGLRIIAGEWRHRKIDAPPGSVTRPTSDRSRETLFSMLASRLGGFTGLAVADLFAGSGALGLEALSRGAASCQFVENDRQALTTLRANIAALRADGASVHALSATRLPARSTPIDLILADPPYASVDIASWLAMLAQSGWAGSGTMIGLETEVRAPPACDRFTLDAKRKVGKAMLWIYLVD